MFFVQGEHVWFRIWEKQCLGDIRCKDRYNLVLFRYEDEYWEEDAKAPLK